MPRMQKNGSTGTAFIGNHLPRQCGIATFTADICRYTADLMQPGDRCFTVAVNDIPQGYRYPESVLFEMRQNSRNDYLAAADFLNINKIDVVSLQHEFGIYGGKAGAHILTLLRELQMPVVTTLHTILAEPAPEYREVMENICRISDKLVSMSHRGLDILRETYGVPADKICFIPHGIPDIPFVDSSYYKPRFDMDGRIVMLTFNLLGPDKNIEAVIDALPEIVASHPEVVYIILGATHPNIRRADGEEYRHALLKRALEAGVADHVIFCNRFVGLEELVEYLCCADIYLTPYINREQIVSGKLSYAMGAGKAVISTPYRYAEEMLADGRGKLVPFHNSTAISKAVIELLGNRRQMDDMRRRAYDHCREMIWPRVAGRYRELFDDVCEGRGGSHHPTRRKGERLPLPGRALPQLPEIRLDHLNRLTDSTGILQHARHVIPARHHGYCTDDNARALLAICAYHHFQDYADAVRLAHIYLAFLDHAFNPENGRFRGFMSYDRRWLDDTGSEDAHGRSLWGLGMAVMLPTDKASLAHAASLFKEALPAVMSFSYIRAQAYSLIGMHAYLSRFGGDRVVKGLQRQLVASLCRAFRDNMTDDWPWPEKMLTYDNARLTEALILTGHQSGDGEALAIGLKSLEWLFEVQTTPSGHLSIVGNDGWYGRGGSKAGYDQQPIDCHALLEAALAAYFSQGDDIWLERAERCINWFLGFNDNDSVMVDFVGGGGYDGLCPDGPNLNQGAESTLAWLTSLMMMEEARALNFIWGAPARFRDASDLPSAVAGVMLADAPAGSGAGRGSAAE